MLVFSTWCSLITQAYIHHYLLKEIIKESLLNVSALVLNHSYAHMHQHTCKNVSLVLVLDVPCVFPSISLPSTWTVSFAYVMMSRIVQNFPYYPIPLVFLFFFPGIFILRMWWESTAVFLCNTVLFYSAWEVLFLYYITKQCLNLIIKEVKLWAVWHSFYPDFVS